MIQTFINIRFERIDKRIKEIDILLNLAESKQYELDIYQALCRSAHVLLVSHFEGLYKEVCKDVLDDINANTTFNQVPKPILNTHCNFFIQNPDQSDASNSIRNKLIEAFNDYPSKIKPEPFLFIDNRNPTPEIIETILKRFGIKNFFWSLKDSDLDIVFKDLKTETLEIRNKLLDHLKHNTQKYPYTVDKSIYKPSIKENQQKGKTLYEDFLDSFLNGRHNIVHGHIIENPLGHEELMKAKLKIEILLFAYIINICYSANPVS